MLQSLICFSLLAVVASAAAVEGKVEVKGASKQSVMDVVVWLKPSTTLPAETGPLSHRTLLQKGKMFRPHVLPVQVNTVVDFPNADPIFHNAFSNYDGQIFDVSLYPPGTTRSVKFRRPGVVRVFCNIHPMMSAIILVLDTPYFTKLDPDGRFHIDGVRPGEYELQVFDERATGEDRRGAPVTVAAGDVQAPVVTISESGYMPVGHKNKYGQDYPAGSAVDTYSEIPK